METIALLLLIGIALIVAEFFLPGAIAGIAGLCLLVAGVILSYMDFGFQTGNAVLFGVLAGLVVTGIIWLKFFPNSRVAKPFISHRVIGGLGVEQPNLLHQSGTAYTDLRPSGTALINGSRVDVVAESQMIAKGASIKVIQVEGMRVVVRAV